MERGNTATQKTLFQEIRNEYKRIDQEWLILHYKTSIGLALFASIVELAMGIGLIHSDMLTTTIPRFVWKFMLLPMLVNSCCIAIETMAMQSNNFSQKQKMYTVSLVFVGICFVLFTVHSAFVTMYYIFAVAIMLTTIYANYRLTIITSLSSIFSIIVSELFIKWDIDKISIYKSTLRLSEFLISLFTLIGFSIACMVAIKFELAKNEASLQIETERQQLQERLQIDEMTGIYNRKALHEAMKDMEDDIDGQYILAMADIDNFKGINDQWGHHLGDRCIIEFAKILTDNRSNATPFRYGGDEFCLLFRNVDVTEAIDVCKQIQTALNELMLEHCPNLGLTASFGLAVYSNQIDSVRLFARSDGALYEAKEARNTIKVYQ